MKLAFILLLCPFITFAQLKPAKIFSSNMVLQRNQPIHIWGQAIPGIKVEVQFSGDTKVVAAKPDSSWHVYFKKQKANIQPQSIIVSSGNKKIEWKNILIGDLWVCTGQSNMEFPMSSEMHFSQEIAQTNQPLLRFYNPVYIGKSVYGTSYTDSMIRRLNRDDFYNGEWQVSDSNSAKKMSAVAYYFGKEIIRSEKVPVGLIHLAIGGCPLETFVNPDVFANNKQLSAKVKGNWLLNESLPVWARTRGKQNIGNNSNFLSDDTNPDHAYKPGFAYETGIKPILPLPIKGIIMYQGESNAQEIERVNEYGNFMKLMVNDYREAWKQSTLPFYFVQLSSIDTFQYKGQLWPSFRNEQRKALSFIKYSGMAVCSDIGSRNDVHPINKKLVGERLSRWALYKTYQQNIIPSGPLPLQAKYANGKVVVRFEYAEEGLRTSDDKKPRGFSLDGRTEADAVINNDTVEIMTDKKPSHIYYGWKSFTDANLVNASQLPASTFKIEVQ